MLIYFEYYRNKKCAIFKNNEPIGIKIIYGTIYFISINSDQ